MSKKNAKQEFPKVAFVISGQIRTFEKLETEFFKTAENLNADIFAHAWENDPDLSILEKCDGKFKSLATSSPLIPNIANTEERSLLNWPKRDIPTSDHSLYHGTYSMIAGIASAYQLMLNHENEFQMKYDLVIRVRFDILLDWPGVFSFIDAAIKNQQIMLLIPPKYSGFDVYSDVLSISPRSISFFWKEMSQNYWTLIQEYAMSSELRVFTPELFLTWYLRRNNFKIGAYFTSAFLVRQDHVLSMATMGVGEKRLRKRKTLDGLDIHSFQNIPWIGKSQQDRSAVLLFIIWIQSIRSRLIFLGFRLASRYSEVSFTTWTKLIAKLFRFS